MAYGLHAQNTMLPDFPVAAILSVFSHGFLGDSDDVPENLLFCGGAVGNQIGNVLFNIGIDHGQAVTYQLIQSHIQGVGNFQKQGQAGFAGAVFRMGYGGGRNIDFSASCSWVKCAFRRCRLIRMPSWL